MRHTPHPPPAPCATRPAPLVSACGIADVAAAAEMSPARHCCVCCAGVRLRLRLRLRRRVRGCSSDAEEADTADTADAADAADAAGRGRLRARGVRAGGRVCDCMPCVFSSCSAGCLDEAGWPGGGWQTPWLAETHTDRCCRVPLLLFTFGGGWTAGGGGQQHRPSVSLQTAQDRSGVLSEQHRPPSPGLLRPLF